MKTLSEEQNLACKGQAGPEGGSVAGRWPWFQWVWVEMSFQGAFKSHALPSGSLETKGALLGTVTEDRFVMKPPVVLPCLCSPCTNLPETAPVLCVGVDLGLFLGGSGTALGKAWRGRRCLELLCAPCSQGKVLLSPKGLGWSWCMPGLLCCHPAPLPSITFLPTAPWCQWDGVGFEGVPGPGPLKGASPLWGKSAACSSPVQWSMGLGTAPSSASCLSCSVPGWESRPSTGAQGGSRVGGDMSVLFPTPHSCAITLLFPAAAAILTVLRGCLSLWGDFSLSPTPEHWQHYTIPGGGVILVQCCLLGSRSLGEYAGRVRALSCSLSSASFWALVFPHNFSPGNW